MLIPFARMSSVVVRKLRAPINEAAQKIAILVIQSQVGFGLDLAEERDRGGGPHQVDPHQQGEEHADEDRGQGEKVVLEADDFVIEAENVFPNETLGGSVFVGFLGNHFYCFSASRAASHLS